MASGFLCLIVKFHGRQVPCHRGHDVTHHGTKVTSKLAFGFNTKVVALCLSFPTHGCGPHSDTHSSSYGLRTAICVFSSLGPFLHYFFQLLLLGQVTSLLGFCLVIGLQSD
ncbi:hypothetical protein QL285_070223 [Trifolium repens]|nr:hypothetical protein QL285_070223 [Trifolium repens]